LVFQIPFDAIKETRPCFWMDVNWASVIPLTLILCPLGAVMLKETSWPWENSSLAPVTLLMKTAE